MGKVKELLMSNEGDSDWKKAWDEAVKDLENYKYNPHIDNLWQREYMGDWIPEVPDKPKCECGAEVTYGKDCKHHASYCPKYQK